MARKYKWVRYQLQITIHSIIRVALTSAVTTLLITSFLTINSADRVYGSTNVKSIIDEGIGLLDSERYEDALALFNKVLKDDPNNVPALSDKGLALDYLGRYEEAIKSYDKALAIDPEQESVLYNKGIVLDKMGKYGEAIGFYDKALAINPEDAEVLADKGDALLSMQKYEEAMASLDKALEIDDKNLKALSLNGFILNYLGRYEEAIRFYDKALAINPDDVDLLNNKRLALKALNQTTSSEPSTNDTKVGAKQATTLTENTNSGPGNLTSFLTYENSTYGIKAQYPSDWTVENAQSNASDDIVPIVYISPPISSDPNANAHLQIGYDGSVQGSNMSLEQYVRDLVEGYKNGNDTSNFNVVSVKSDTTLAGKPGYSLVSTDTEDGIDMKSIEVGTFVGDKLYYVVFSAEEPKFNTFLPDVQKMIDSFEITDGEQVKQVKKEVNVSNNVSNVNSNLTFSKTENGTGPSQESILMKLELQPSTDGDRYEVGTDEVISTNAKICPTNKCQLSLLGPMGPGSSGGLAALVSKSDESGYTFEGTLHVTDNDAQGNSIGSRLYDINMDLDKAGSKKADDVTTETLKGVMTSTDETNSQLKTEYAVDGTLHIAPNIVHEEVPDVIELGPVTLNLSALEK